MKTFSQFLNEGTKSKVPCRRCGGSGKYSYNLIHGTKCYGCNGTGFQMVDLEKEKKSIERKQQNRAEEIASQEEKAKQFDQKIEMLRKKYKDDPRLGGYIKKRMHEFPAVEQETLLTLDRHDTKGDVHPSVIEAYGVTFLNVPYSKKDLARSFGAVWDPSVRKWTWNVSKKLPKELEPFVE